MIYIDEFFVIRLIDRFLVVEDLSKTPVQISMNVHTLLLIEVVQTLSGPDKVVSWTFRD